MLSNRIFRHKLLWLVLAAACAALPMGAAAQSSTTAPSASTAVKFPPPAASNFNAASPTRAEVEAFLKQQWGYDTNRVWQVWAIVKTPAPGVSKVVVQVAEKNDPKHRIGDAMFLVTPDGKHLIAANLQIQDFGPHPFAAARAVLQQRANGPSRGAAGKQYLMVEFADFECPHCKAAQPVMAQLYKDFPQIHFVFENFPLIHIHPSALKAAEYSVCVAKQSGNAKFFEFADNVFADQQGLTPDTADATLGAAATKAGLSADKVGGCSYGPTAKATVMASRQLGEDLNVDETPTLFFNGRKLPLAEVANGQVPYSVLKQIVEYQIKQDQ